MRERDYDEPDLDPFDDKAETEDLPAASARGARRRGGKAPEPQPVEEEEFVALDDDFDLSPRETDADADEAPESTGTPKRRAGRVDLSPRGAVVIAPSIPLPVRELARTPSLDERAKSIDERLRQHPNAFVRAHCESFDMSWIFHDTGLEGTIYTYEELAAVFTGADTSRADSSLLPVYDAIARSREAVRFVREQAEKSRLPLTVDLVKRIYTILHPEEGDVRTLKYRRDVPQHRLYFHEYAQPDKIALKLRAVIDWINAPDTKKNVPAIKLAAKAHYDIARTYPFTHDSGTVARLFMNLLLLRSGLPPAIIHHSERQRYYDALKAPTASQLSQMLHDSVENSLASIEKRLDEAETHKRAFVS